MSLRSECFLGLWSVSACYPLLFSMHTTTHNKLKYYVIISDGHGWGPGHTHGWSDGSDTGTIPCLMELSGRQSDLLPPSPPSCGTFSPPFWSLCSSFLEYPHIRYLYWTNGPPCSARWLGFSWRECLGHIRKDYPSPEEKWNQCFDDCVDPLFPLWCLPSFGVPLPLPSRRFLMV
ncbi:hypothetical protein BU26DRAFT_212972 [Trematosphaeria pertusa]|uniref:Uncharacterized protein n=1 Tax=Trematosphaeria pertusa TaxID=390896 RepID=A0A6A6IRQ8_9PLEO|nr:uncharacterized protein BU26DRAFT_212972 [Trematosphaeria pertusa]KAF2252999.1 hypothetical protein BU26DRAFT_212972 [Trematosphaeria pertusa]